MKTLKEIKIEEFEKKLKEWEKLPKDTEKTTTSYEGMQTTTRKDGIKQITKPEIKYPKFEEEVVYCLYQILNKLEGK